MPTYLVMRRHDDECSNLGSHLELATAIQAAEEKAAAHPRWSFFVMKVERTANETRKAELRSE